MVGYVYCMKNFIVALVLACPLFAQTTWTRAFPALTGNQLTQVTFANNAFLVTGWNGTLLRSSDGTNWTNENLAPGVNLGQWFSDGKKSFITSEPANIQGSWGAYMYSEDGTTWTYTNPTELTFMTYGVASNNAGTYVMVGRSETSGSKAYDIAYSTDGKKWTITRPFGYSSDPPDLLNVQWINNQFVSCGQSGGLMYSADGITWMWEFTGVQSTLSNLVWNGSQYLVVGGMDTVLTSPDLQKWTKHVVGANTDFHQIIWDGSRYIGYTDHLSNNDVESMMTSTDGATWTITPTNQPHNLYSLAFGNGKYVAVGSYGTIATSPDGLTWSVVNEPTGHTLYSVNTNGSQFLAIGSDRQTYHSNNGSDWVSSMIKPYVYNTSFATMLWSRWDGNAWNIGSNFRQTYNSTDAATWTDTTYTNYDYNGAGSIAFGAGVYVLAGNSAGMSISTDGYHWKSNPFTTAIPGLTSIAFGGGQFVSVGYWGAAVRSVDGYTWTQVTILGKQNFTDVIWDGSRFVAVGDSGRIATSSDGTAWKVTTSVTKNNLRGITFANNQYVAVGDHGTLIVSDDAATWYGRNAATQNNLNSVIADSKQFVAVGDWATIVTSPFAPFTTRIATTKSALQGFEVRREGSQLRVTAPRGEWVAKGEWVELRTLQGKLLGTSKLSQGRASLNLGQLSPGIVQCIVHGSSGNMAQSILIP